MDTVIGNLDTLNLDLEDEKTIKYLIGRCKSEEDFRRLDGQTPSGSEAEKKVREAWDEFILPEIEERISNCKSVEDFKELDRQTPSGLEAERKVREAREKFFLLEIENCLNLKRKSQIASQWRTLRG
ncbi:MAG: hypothetical protein KAR00_01410 [Candidatus Pacebacteria bacterium]|nr:hypothetical protein [Candidatus Paceibacterota bacterium]